MKKEYIFLKSKDDGERLYSLLKAHFRKEKEILFIRNFGSKLIFDYKENTTSDD